LLIGLSWRSLGVLHHTVSAGRRQAAGRNHPRDLAVMLTPPGRMPNDPAMSRLGKLLPWLDQHPAMRALVVHVGRIERVTLVSIILAATVLLAFAKLADAVGEGGTRAFDERILLALRTPGNLADPIGPRWLEEMMRDFTALGGTGVLALMSLAVGGFLGMTRKGHAALLVLVAVVGGVLVSQTMKWAYARPRPELVPHGTEIYTASFPSGHSMMSAIVYLTLGALLARTQSVPSVKVYILAIAVFLTLLVGISRVYLGVHWPTDVLAGWALGGVWALACWMVMAWLQERGQVERETQ
jgi:undecaprenyl-diphosphatase